MIRERRRPRCACSTLRASPIWARWHRASATRSTSRSTVIRIRSESLLEELEGPTAEAMPGRWPTSSAASSTASSARPIAPPAWSETCARWRTNRPTIPSPSTWWRRCAGRRRPLCDEQLKPPRSSSMSTCQDADHGAGRARTSLQQVLINLVFNARDAVRAEGPAPAGIRDRGSAAIAINWRPTGWEAAWSSPWTMTARAFPPEVLTRLFEPFFTTKPIDKGTGLGAVDQLRHRPQHGRRDRGREPGRRRRALSCRAAAAAARAGRSRRRRLRSDKASGCEAHAAPQTHRRPPARDRETPRDRLVARHARHRPGRDRRRVPDRGLHHADPEGEQPHRPCRRREPRQAAGQDGGPPARHHPGHGRGRLAVCRGGNPRNRWAGPPYRAGRQGPDADLFAEAGFVPADRRRRPAGAGRAGTRRRAPRCRLFGPRLCQRSSQGRFPQHLCRPPLHRPREHPADHSQYRGRCGVPTVRWWACWLP